MGVFAIGAALGGLAAYFFDPGTGAGRRRRLRDRVATFLRFEAPPGGHASPEVPAEVHGFSQKVERPQEEEVRNPAVYAERDVA